MTRELPSPQFLRKILRYDAETGRLFWRYRMPDTFNCASKAACLNAALAFNTRFCGTEAFTSIDGGGYLCGRINNRKYKAAHVIWAMLEGTWPQETGFVVDHINRVRTDNRISNLRLITKLKNSWNRSDVAGVYLDRRTNRWEARITASGKSHNLGRFDTREEAREVRLLAEQERWCGRT